MVSVRAMAMVTAASDGLAGDPKRFSHYMVMLKHVYLAGDPKRKG